MKTKCPYCGYIATEHSRINFNRDKPMNGDFSFCIHCGESSIFTSKGLAKADVTKMDMQTKEYLFNLRNEWLKVHAVERFKGQNEQDLL